jgi:hypothetical protein
MGLSASDLQIKLQKRKHSQNHQMDEIFDEGKAKKAKAYANQSSIDDAHKQCAYGHEGCKK